MKKSTILALSLLLILAAVVSIVVLGPRLGLTIIGSNSTGTTTSNASTYTTTVTSTSTATTSTVFSGNALYSWFTNRSKAIDIFNGLVDAFRSFLSSITSRIKESPTRLDVVVNAVVYAVIFFILGKLASLLVNIFKWIMYILAIFCIAVAILVMIGAI
jgi:hypothetical protein